MGGVEAKCEGLVDGWRESVRDLMDGWSGGEV